MRSVELGVYSLWSVLSVAVQSSQLYYQLQCCIQQAPRSAAFPGIHGNYMPKSKQNSLANRHSTLLGSLENPILGPFQQYPLSLISVLI